MGSKSYTGSSRAIGGVRWAPDFPVATYILIAMNILFYIGSSPIDPKYLAEANGVIPANHDYLALFQSMFQSTFLHLSPMHLIMNMLFLWLFGRRVEKALGPIIYLIFFIGSGFMASVLHVAISYAFLPSEMLHMPVLGASGAIAGVLGMYAVRFRKDRTSIGKFSFPIITLLFAWLLFQVVLGIMQVARATQGFDYTNVNPSDLGLMCVGYWSHIGGFIFGMTAAWVITMREKTVKRHHDHTGLRKKTLKEIAGLYETLVLADPDDVFSCIELGRVWALLGNQPKSTASYLQAIELYRKGGNRDEALAVLDESMRFWPESVLSPDTSFRFACYLETLGRYEDASRCFTCISDRAEGLPEAEMSLIKLGQVELDRLRNPEKSIEVLERLLRDHPTSKWTVLAEQLLSRARDVAETES